jgi:hypothetical protein
MTYRTGNHWGVTIVREAQQAPNGSHWHGGGPCEECPRQAELVAVVVNGDQALAERICALLNADQLDPEPCTEETLSWDHFQPQQIDRYWISCGLAGPHDVHKDGHTGLSWRDVKVSAADSCTCTIVGPHPDCPVHHGRRARGPKPPPVGPGCICDGSGHTCPRHGAVI